MNKFKNFKGPIKIHTQNPAFSCIGKILEVNDVQQCLRVQVLQYEGLMEWSKKEQIYHYREILLMIPIGKPETIEVLYG